MEISLPDLKAHYVVVQDEILAAVAEVLESQVCIGGRCREWIQSLKKSYGQSVTPANPAVMLKALAV
jgi:hypothetical protein